MEAKEDEEESDEGETSYLPPKGEMLMIKRVLHATETSLEANQREQIFHSRCKVVSKTCNLIIDRGSCTNVISIEMVSKLNMAII